MVAELVEQDYPTGVKISDAEFASIALQLRQTQPLRNYTTCPPLLVTPRIGFVSINPHGRQQRVLPAGGRTRARTPPVWLECP